MYMCQVVFWTAWLILYYIELFLIFWEEMKERCGKYIVREFWAQLKLSKRDSGMEPILEISYELSIANICVTGSGNTLLQVKLINMIKYILLDKMTRCYI